MIVVSDTTPLISLLKINRIDLMEKLFGAVMIPTAVFDELTADLVDRTAGPVQQALADAGITSSQLTKVLLVGGSTRIPAV